MTAEQLEKNERKITKKILEPRLGMSMNNGNRLNNQYTRKSMKKRGVQFYGHLLSMKQERLSQKI